MAFDPTIYPSREEFFRLLTGAYKKTPVLPDISNPAFGFVFPDKSVLLRFGGLLFVRVKDLAGGVVFDPAQTLSRSLITAHFEAVCDYSICLRARNLIPDALTCSIPDGKKLRINGSTLHRGDCIHIHDGKVSDSYTWDTEHFCSQHQGREFYTLINVPRRESCLLSFDDYMELL